MASEPGSTAADDILRLLKRPGKTLTDAELAKKTKRSHQAINQAARALEAQGLIIRRPGPDGAIHNMAKTKLGRLKAHSLKRATPEPRRATDGGSITEDEVKVAIKSHLEGQGWSVTVAWGRARGVDIEATRRGHRLLIEAKGEVESQPQQATYFLGALGELVQRMDDPKAEYGLALPDNSQYRGLVGRLPKYAVERLGLVVFWVNSKGRVTRSP